MIASVAFLTTLALLLSKARASKTKSLQLQARMVTLGVFLLNWGALCSSRELGQRALVALDQVRIAEPLGPKLEGDLGAVCEHQGLARFVRSHLFSARMIEA